MKHCLKTSLLLPLVFLLLFPCICLAYTQQAYIDSLVQTALYGFNEAAAAPMDREKKQREAIKYAKKVARDLRRLAVGDPNEKYILWRQNELEGQIYLEENDLQLAGANKNAMAINELIGPFNDALNQKRPDFKRLQSLLQRMQAVSEDKASEMEVAIFNRKQLVTRNVISVFENAIADNITGLARAELVYCADNQGLLNISLTQYGQMAAKLASRTTASDEQGFVAASLKRADELLNRNTISEASVVLHVAQSRLAPIKDAIIRTEWDKLDGRMHTLLGRVADKEDSLVKRNLAILKTQGIQAADSFLDSVLSPQMADRDKVAYVNDEIMNVVALQRKQEVSPICAEIAALTKSADSPLEPLDDLAALARKRSRARADSSRLATSEKGRLTQPEEVRRERMLLAQEGMRKREERSQQSKEVVSHTEVVRKDRITVAQEGKLKRQDDALRLKRERAQQSLVEIYTLLEQKKVSEAAGRFKKEGSLLKEMLPAADYDSLALRVARK